VQQMSICSRGMSVGHLITWYANIL